MEVQGAQRGAWEDGKAGEGDWEDGEVGDAAGWKCLSSRAYERKMGEEEGGKKNEKRLMGGPQVKSLIPVLVSPNQTKNGTISSSTKHQTGSSRL